MNVTSTATSGILYAYLSGEFTLDEGKRTFSKVLGLIKEHKIRKVLVDGREVAGEPETLERFFYGEFAAHSVRDLMNNHRSLKTPCFAYVLTGPVIDPQRLGETVAINRGMCVKVFDDYTAAVAWLEGK